MSPVNLFKNFYTFLVKVKKSKQNFIHQGFAVHKQNENLLFFCKMFFPDVFIFKFLPFTNKLGLI